MTRALLVDTGFSAAPLRAALDRAGHDVTLVGARPDDALARASAPRVAVDYGGGPGLREAIDRTGADHLVPGCNDVSLLRCAEVAAEAGIGGHDRPDVVRELLDKRAFRQLCAAVGVAAPRLLADDEAVGRDVVVKPRRAYSGHGVTILTTATAEGLATAVAAARVADDAGGHLVEEHVEGQLYSHSAFVVDGRVVTEFWVLESGTATPLAVDVSHVVDPPATVAGTVRDEVERIVAHLGLGDGLVHTQLLVDGASHALVEITRRCPGDLYASLVVDSCGYDYAAAYVAGFTGGTIRRHDDPPPRRPVLRVTLSSQHPLLLSGVELSADLPPMRLLPLGRVGDPLGRGPDGRFGVMFLYCRSDHELASLYDAAHRRELFRPLGPALD